MMRRTVSLLLAGVMLAGCAGAEPSGTATELRTPAKTAAGAPNAEASVTATPTEPVPATPEPPVEVVEVVLGGPWPGVRETIEVDARQLAKQIFAIETALRDPATEAGPFERAAQQQQFAYRRLADDPTLWGEVAPLIDEAFRHDAQLQVSARLQFNGMHTRPIETLPAWSIEDPTPADDLLQHTMDAAANSDVPWQYLAAVNLVETGMGRIRGLSTAGAQGPMQFLPTTWPGFSEPGEDIEDPRDALFAAGRFLRSHGMAEGRISASLFRYNNSNRYVRAVEAYAELMLSHPRAYEAFHAWQIAYRTNTEHGDLVLPVGYLEPERIAIADWLGKG